MASRRLDLMGIVLRWFAIAAVVVSVRISTATPLELVGGWSYGPVRHVAVESNRVYRVAGSVLQVIDISDPNVPRILGETDLGFLVKDMDVADGHVFTTFNRQAVTGFRIFDATRPSSISEVAVVDWEYGFAREIVVADGVAAVFVETWRNPAIRLFDVSVPSAPRFLAQISNTYWRAGFEVFEGLVFAETEYLYEYAFEVHDISNPADPSLLGRIELDYGLAFSHMTVSGPTVFTTSTKSSSGISTLHVIDVGDPTSPREVNSYGLGTFDPVGLTVEDDILRVVGSGNQAGELRVIDVSDPLEPMELAVLTMHAPVDLADFEGGCVVADECGGTRLIDLAVPDEPVEMSRISAPGSTLGIAFLGDLAFAADDCHGLRVFDMSVSAAPTEIGLWQASGLFSEPSASGHHVLVLGNDPPGLNIVDVRDPANPVGVGHFPVNAVGFSVTGDHVVLLGGQPWGLRVIDISRPSQPEEIGQLPVPGHQVETSNDLAFVVENTLDAFDLLRIIDLNAPSVPVEISETRLNDWTVEAFDVEKDLLFTQWGGMQIYDVGHPEAPVLVGECCDRCPELPSSGGLIVDGGFAYLATSEQIGANDVRNPLNPRCWGRAWTPRDRFSHFSVFEDFLVVSNSSMGFMVFRKPDSTFSRQGPIRRLQPDGRHAVRRPQP